MSYILEALKKSEQERRRGEVPEINRFDAQEVSDERKLGIWPIVVAALIAVNLAVLFFWAPWEQSVPADAVVAPGAAGEQDESAVAGAAGSRPSDASERSGDVPAARPGGSKVSATGEDRVKVAPAKLPDVAPREPVKPAITPEPEPAAVSQPEPEVIRPRRAAEPEPEPEIIRPRSTPSTSYLPQLQELPANLQQQVPDLSFSSHMYSSEPRFRSIIINGRRLKEGQFLDDRIQVREITDKGVVLSLDGTLFEVDVLGQWVN
ncbi:MAG: general secretion pathway protein GspB [Ketobacteraceae bacterium]|nr:general secretion pathway protein GspB [Ketobacteraceae bacterium]